MSYCCFANYPMYHYGSHLLVPAHSCLPAWRVASSPMVWPYAIFAAPIAISLAVFVLVVVESEVFTVVSFLELKSIGVWAYSSSVACNEYLAEEQLNIARPLLELGSNGSMFEDSIIPGWASTTPASAFMDLFASRPPLKLSPAPAPLSADVGFFTCSSKAEALNYRIGL